MKYVYLFFAFGLLSLLILSACEAEQSSDMPKQNSDKQVAQHKNSQVQNDNENTQDGKGGMSSHHQLSFTYNGQSFKIIPMFADTLNFTHRVQAGDETINKDDVYFNQVVNVFLNKSDASSLGYSHYFSYGTNIDKLEKTTEKLMDMWPSIRKTIKKALVKSAKQLPGTDIKVFVKTQSPVDMSSFRQQAGISAVTSRNGKIVLMQILPSVRKNLISYTVAHEYNHTVVASYHPKLGSRGRTVMDHILLEGRADTFAKKIYPNVSLPWLKEPLTEQQLKYILTELKTMDNAFDRKVKQKLLVGAGLFPRWSDYKLGYTIMKDYLQRHPNAGPEEWSELTTEEILKQSAYEALIPGRS